MTPDFSASAQKLARNPLGIIALFLLLVYGIAGLVFSVAAKGLSASERQPLVWFLVIFPVLVLAMFFWLVARHHTKLYAPSDYRDSEGFFRALTGLTVAEQRARLDAEVESLQVDTTDTEPKRFIHEISVEKDRAEIPNEVSRIAEAAPPSAGSADHRVSTAQLVERRRGELRETVVLAEELAFRKLESEFRLPVLRHMSLTDGSQIDGLIRTPVRPTAVEIKYVRSVQNLDRLSRNMVAQLSHIERGSTIGPLQVLLAIVVDGLKPEEHHLVERILERRVDQQHGRIAYRVYDLEALKKEFGVAPT